MEGNNGENTGTIIDRGTAESTSAIRNSGSDGEREKARSYLAALSQRNANSTGGDTQPNPTNSNDLGQSGRNVRLDGAGTGSNGEGTGNISDGTNSNRRADRTTERGNTKTTNGNKKSDHLEPTRNTVIDIKVPKNANKNSNKKEIAVVLNDKEAKDIQEKLVGALQAIFEWMDDAIGFTNKNQAKALIWTQIDKEDVEKIAIAILSIGKRQAQVAIAVRGIVNSYIYLEAGIITSQKFIETFQFYRANGGFSLPGVF